MSTCPCPESAKRAAMSDGEFWEYVLSGFSGDRVEDLDEPDPNEPWDSGFETTSRCSECGEVGACAYDAEGRALIHAAPHHDAGVVAVIVALTMTLIFTVLAGLITMGMVDTMGARAQAAADSAALAAAGYLVANGWDPGGATNSAKSYAEANLKMDDGEWSSCTDSQRYTIAPTTQCVSFDTTNDVVRVAIPPQTVPLILGSFLGLADSANVTRVAQATWRVPVRLVR